MSESLELAEIRAVLERIEKLLEAIHATQKEAVHD